MNTAPLSLIVQRPQRLKVGVMACCARLRFVRKIKGRQRLHMVKMPRSVVAPAHSWQKSRRDVEAKILNGHAEIANGRHASRLAHHGLAESVAQVLRDAPLQVFRALPCVIGARYSQVAIFVLSAPLFFPSELLRVVFGALSAAFAAFPVSVSDPLSRLFRRVQDAAGLSAGRAPSFRRSKRLFPIAPDADVVWASQPGQLWVTLANLAGASFRKR